MPRPRRFYNDPAWQRTRKAFLKAFPWCRHCAQEGVVRPATQVDHILPLTQGGAPLAWSNLQQLCLKHHTLKTWIEDRGKQRAGVAVDGTPLSPNHWWNQ